jgi:hypothetical protein
MSEHDDKLQTDDPSCVSGMTRKEFVTKLLTRAAIAGAIFALATELNKHALPSALASATTATTT